MPSPLRLMAVHAHPDDEVLPTGGTLARYAREGIETAVVVCTDGSQGFAPGFANPGEPGHDPEAVAAVRRRELLASCALLGVSRVEMLGYRDSGMRGWAGNADPAAFTNAPLERAAGRLAALIADYRPHVLVTYDNSGGSGHPDHVKAHEVTLAAHEATGTAAKLYYTVRAASYVEAMRKAREAIDFQSPRPSSGRPPSGGVPDEEVTTVIDTSSTAAAKLAALRAHDSQLNGSHWLALPPEVLAELFSRETFIRAIDTTGAAIPEDDLFAGLR